MAKHLARIHGTEEDKVNCPFYFKIGACRHADRCSRIHHRPAFSQTILIKHIYNHPVREAELNLLASGQDRTTASANIINLKNGNEGGNPIVDIDPKKAMEDFLVFFEDFYAELSKFGHLECLHICDNLGDHMVGHVYAKFTNEDEAADALNILNGRYYNGKKMEVEFSPVTDFREARCRDFDEDTCSRGGFCNFMHVKPVPPCLLRDMEQECDEERRELKRKKKEGGKREIVREERKESIRIEIGTVIGKEIGIEIAIGIETEIETEGGKKSEVGGVVAPMVMMGEEVRDVTVRIRILSQEVEVPQSNQSTITNG